MARDEVVLMWMHLAEGFRKQGNLRWATYCEEQAKLN